MTVMLPNQNGRNWIPQWCILEFSPIRCHKGLPWPADFLTQDITK